MIKSSMVLRSTSKNVNICVICKYTVLGWDQTVKLTLMNQMVKRFTLTGILNLEFDDLQRRVKEVDKIKNIYHISTV